jgi:hypothetical protein
VVVVVGAAAAVAARNAARAGIECNTCPFYHFMYDFMYVNLLFVSVYIAVTLVLWTSENLSINVFYLQVFLFFRLKTNRMLPTAEDLNHPSGVLL